tara:strand:- start:146 stop:454 length:309 start_codon:yes stop_codon:yes gene_type:complete
MNLEKLQDLIDSTISLADSVDPSGKIAKHADGVPEPDMDSNDDVVDWVLDLYEPIADAAHVTRNRLYDLARMIEDGDDIVFDVAAKITKELSPEFGEPDEDQ